MSALANQKGGLILIGVKDDGKIEGMEYDKGHEEHIMNIATDYCDPPIRPRFMKVDMSDGGFVYIIKILGRPDETYHGVRTKDGLVYFIRVGSTIREMLPSELSKPKSKGVETEPYTSSEKGLLIITDKLLSFASRKLRWSLSKTMLFFAIVGALFLAGSISLIFGIAYGSFGPSSNFPTWINFFLAIWLVAGGYLCISIPTIAAETKCPACRSFFKYRIAKSEILGKRRKSKEIEEWKVRNFRRCDICGYEKEKVEYEDHHIE